MTIAHTPPPDHEGPAPVRKRHRRSVLARPLYALARELHRRPVQLLALLTVGALVFGALYFMLFEHDAVHSFWDGLFLAGASATTSETYDISPHTGWGKLMTVLLGFAGITLGGCFVAAVTAIIIQGPEPEYEREEYGSLLARLERIERLVCKIERRTAGRSEHKD